MGSSKRAANRRKFQRVRIEPALAVVHDPAEAPHAQASLPPLVSEDISPDGAFLRTAAAFPVGQRLHLQLHLPTMTTPLTCQVHVTRVERRLNGELRGIGVQFFQPSNTFLQQLVEHLYRSYQAQYAGQ